MEKGYLLETEKINKRYQKYHKDIDYILVGESKITLPKPDANFLSKVWHEIVGFINSFFKFIYEIVLIFYTPMG